jgi:hypothetical protein
LNCAEVQVVEVQGEPVVSDGDSYLTCYRVLEANHEPRAAVLETGYQVLQSCAATLSDPANRQS